MCYISHQDIFAVIGRGLYAEVNPERFGNLAKVGFTLFQVITLDDWYLIYTDIIGTNPSKHVWYCCNSLKLYNEHNFKSIVTFKF